MTQIDKLSSKDVLKYYHSLGSRIGYRLLLHGTKHFGYYNKNDHFWQFGKAMRQMEDFMGRNLNLPPGSRVLDAGCGMGFVAARLADRFGLRVDGIDLLDFNIAAANKRKRRLGLVDILNLRVGDYTKLPLRSDYYDGIYTMETIMHVPDTPMALRKFYKAMKPGGTLVMHEYSHAGKSNMPDKLYREMTLMNELSSMPSLQEFEHGVLESMIAKAGFKNVQSQNLWNKMQPMVFGFYVLAVVPYTLLKTFGLDEHMPNTSAAIIFHRNHKYFRYNVIKATK